jgi:hypothetical protein
MLIEGCWFLPFMVLYLKFKWIVLSFFTRLKMENIINNNHLNKKADIRENIVNYINNFSYKMINSLIFSQLYEKKCFQIIKNIPKTSILFYLLFLQVKVVCYVAFKPFLISISLVFPFLCQDLTQIINIILIKLYVTLHHFNEAW